MSDHGPHSGFLGLASHVCCGLAVWLLATSAAAQVVSAPDSRAVEQNALPSVPASSPSEVRSSENLSETFGGYESLWSERLQWLLQGREDKAAEVVDRIRQQASQDGVKNLDLFASALVREALNTARTAPVQAQKRFEAAKQLAPDLPGVYLAEGWVLLEQGPEKYLDSLRAYGAAVRASARGFWTEYYWLGSLMLIGWVAMAFVLLSFALIMLLSYFTKLHHHLYELLGRALPSLVVRVLLAIVLLAPLVTEVGIGWVGIFWLALLWRYMTTRERVVAFCLIGAVGVGGALLPHGAGVFKDGDSPVLESMVQVYRGEAIERFPEVPEAVGPETWKAYFARGLFHHRIGQVAEARRQYERAIALNPHAYQAWVNLGNLHFTARRVRESIASYLHAVESNPQSVEAHYNLAQAYRDNLQFNEGTASYERAQDLDQRLTDIYAERRRRDPQQTVVNAEIDSSDLWHTAWTLRAEKNAVGNAILHSYLGTWPLTGLPVTHTFMPVLTVLLGVFFGVLGLPKGGDRLPFLCQFCNRMICRKCQRLMFKKRLCIECGERAKRGQQPDELAEQFLRSSATRAPLALALVPGAMELYSHKTVTGLFLHVMFYGAVWSVAVGYALVPYPTAIPESATTFIPGVLLAVVVVVGCYLRTAWQLHTRGTGR